jgi:hypothetical protein
MQTRIRSVSRRVLAYVFSFSIRAINAEPRRTQELDAQAAK